MRGDGRVWPRGSKFWIDYYVNGRRVREYGGLTEREALRKLKARKAAVLCGQYIPPEETKLTVEELLAGLETNLQTKGAKSIGSTRSHLKPIREAFGEWRALNLTSAHLSEYVRAQQETGKANATINRGLQGLRAAFHLARKQGRIRNVPYFPMLKEDNTRRGFFEGEEFEAVVVRLPEPVADAARFAYRTGWRRGEVVGLRWEHVDRAAGEVRLFTSKNGEGRTLPLAGSLLPLIEKRWRAREFAGADGATRLSAFVFHVNGEPLGDFRKSWARACREAGVGRKLFHDLRRTAARDMIRAGVPETVARTITGHKTRSMFDRYNITSDTDKRQAIERTDSIRTVATDRGSRG